MVSKTPTKAPVNARRGWQPGQPYPSNADLKTVAQIITHEMYPVSHRTLERWPLVVRQPNGRRIVNVAEALSMAKAKFDAAAPYKLAADS